MSLDSEARVGVDSHHPGSSVNGTIFPLTKEGEEGSLLVPAVPVSALPQKTPDTAIICIERGGENVNLGQGEIERALDSLAAY